MTRKRETPFYIDAAPRQTIKLSGVGTVPYGAPPYGTLSLSFSLNIFFLSFFLSPSLSLSLSSFYFFVSFLFFFL